MVIIKMCLRNWTIIVLVSIITFTKAVEDVDATCGHDQYQCKNGDCIPMNYVCDGDQDCDDKSDETLSLCRRISSETSSFCVLPPYPAHGTYEVGGLPNAQPGQQAESFVLTVSCRRGYGVVNPNGDGSGTQQVYCVNGQWYQDMPKCVRFCKLNPDPSVRYNCYVSGKGFETCKEFVPPGTSIDPVCNYPIYYTTEIMSSMRCLAGVWNYVALCKAECGRITPVGSQLVINGKQAKRGELPWYVGIYRKSMSSSFQQICGGSLVSNNLVISAAHCFWTFSKKLLPANEFGVAAGKLHRSWDSNEDVDAQKSDVKQIKIPYLYQGEAANFQEDIAALILANPFNYTTYIQPVCLNFNFNFDRLQLQPGKLGKVAGWGLTGANGVASPTLRVAEMPFIDVDICVNNLPLSFRAYITGDKFCAGYTNGISLCQGDSGGGLAFSDKELGIDRYYLRGVVSTAPNEDNKLCNDMTYTAFTKITKHEQFIKEVLVESARKICPLYSFQCADGACVDPGSDCNGIPDCADGSDESDELCRAGSTSITILEVQPTLQPATGEPAPTPLNSSIKPDEYGPFYSDSDPILVNFTTPRPSLLNTPEDVLYFPDTNTSILLNTSRPPTDNMNSKPLVPPLELDKECGIEPSSNSHNMKDIPWLAAIYIELQFVCGGTLISDSHVITVASIVRTTSLWRFLVKLGRHPKPNMDEEISNEFAITRKVISLSTVKSYYKTAYVITDDVSILELDKKVEFNMYIRPVCLWKGNTEVSDIVGEFALFAGWGSNKFNDSKVLEPHVLDFSIVSAEECRQRNLLTEELESNKTVCTENMYGYKPCKGDTGGGLYLLDRGRWRLRGMYPASITSPFQSQGCDVNKYSVFIDLVHFWQWIVSILSKKIIVNIR